MQNRKTQKRDYLKDEEHHLYMQAEDIPEVLVEQFRNKIAGGVPN